MARSRIGLWFAATLAVPALFAGAGLWVHHGGPLHGAMAAEALRALAVHEEWQQASANELGAAARAVPVHLQLDAARRVVGPFGNGVAAVVEIGADERVACAHIARADPQGALPHFLRARLGGQLSAEGRLLEARALGHVDLAAARDLLAAATLQMGEARCGNLPFALLAALLEAEWSTAAGAEPDAAVATELLRAAQAAPAPAMPAIADAIVAVRSFW